MQHTYIPRRGSPRASASRRPRPQPQRAHRGPLHPGLAFVLGLSLASLVACEPDPDQRAELETSDDSVICGGDNRVFLWDLNNPAGSVGAIVTTCSSDTDCGCSGCCVSGRCPGICTGTAIGPNKVLTAQHCVGGTSVSRLAFRPQFGILSWLGGPQGIAGVRMVQGRDNPAPCQTSADCPVDQHCTSWGQCSLPIRGDWAIITLAGNLTTTLRSTYQSMSRAVAPAGPVSVTNYGYGGFAYMGRPSTQTCTAQRQLQASQVTFDCDTEGGSSGGPLWRWNGSSAEVVGVVSAHGQAPCDGANGNLASDGVMFAFAPDNAGALAAARTMNGRTIVYASDLDWNLVASRQHGSATAGSSFAPWTAFDSAPPPSRGRMTAVNLANGFQQLWMVDAQAIKTRWQLCPDGCWTAWVNHATPAPILDLASSGGPGLRTHLFALDTSGRVWVSHKTGDWASLWSAWTVLGTRPGARAIAAVAFNGTNQVFVAYRDPGGDSGGVQTAWGANGTYTSLRNFSCCGGAGTWWRSVAAGVMQDGRVAVFGSLGNGNLLRSDRALDGSSWSWTSMPQPFPGQSFGVPGFEVLAAARELDGKFRLIGIANGEVFSRVETTPTGSGNATFGPWRRFYD